jgi:hypothetical protein
MNNNNLTLFDIQKELLEIESRIEELPPESAELLLAEWLNTYGKRKDKLDGYARLIGELEARAKLRREEAQRLSKRAQIDENKAQLLREILLNFFSTQGLKTVETDRYRITLAKNAKRPLILDENASIPEEFLLKEPDRTLIRSALEKGKSLDFARLGEPTYSIRIK